MESLTYPFINALFWFYQQTGSLGWAIIAVTLLLRIILLPIVLPSLKSAKKMRELSPKLKELQAKYKDDKTKLAQAQMDFYRENGVNPTSGCLPQIFQIAVLIIFFNAFNHIILFSEGKIDLAGLNRALWQGLKVAEGFSFDMNFLGMNLADMPAKLFGANNMVAFVPSLVLLVASGVSQYITAKIMTPEAKTSQIVVAKETPQDKEDDMMAMMRTQSLYIMPLMSIVIGWNFANGMILYWLVSSLGIIVQQVVVEKWLIKEDK